MNQCQDPKTYPLGIQKSQKYDGKLSPAERLNGKRYADSWLKNLLLSASMNGTSGYQ